MIKKDFKTMRALNGLRVCGNMDEYSLTRIITPSRIRRLKKEHIIEKVSYQDLHICKEKNQYTYKLTTYGKQLTRKFLNKGNFQSGRGSERHNTALGHEYSKLKKEEQISCMNEMDLKNYLNEQYIYLLNENKIDDTFNLNNKAFEKYLENTTEPVEPTQNDEFISDRPDIPGRKWKFLGDYVDTSIEDRPVESTRDISKDRNLYSDYEQEKLQNLPSSEFINFNDLKSGKLDDKETSKFIMPTGNENKNSDANMNTDNNGSNQFLEVPTKREISPSNTPIIDTNNNVTNISNIANNASNNNDNYANNMMINNIKLDGNVSDNDNFFDDFFDD